MFRRSVSEILRKSAPGCEMDPKSPALLGLRHTQLHQKLNNHDHTYHTKAFSLQTKYNKKRKRKRNDHLQEPFPTLLDVLLPTSTSSSLSSLPLCRRTHEDADNRLLICSNCCCYYCCCCCWMQASHWTHCEHRCSCLVQSRVCQVDVPDEIWVVLEQENFEDSY